MVELLDLEEKKKHESMLILPTVSTSYNVRMIKLIEDQGRLILAAAREEAEARKRRQMMM